MNWKAERTNIYVPSERPAKEALERTTHLAVGAHPDDLEVMCWHGIVSCFRKSDQWFTGVTVTDGAGCSRGNAYARFTDAEMVDVRAKEQQAAALSGDYSAMVSFMYSSKEVRETRRRDLVDDFQKLLELTRPEYLYTHNLLDKHNTHIAIATALVEAARRSGLTFKGFHGCEVWRGLDWIPDSMKVRFDVSAHEGLTRALVGIFDSQITGGKRYDLATVGRKRANATYLDAYSADPVSHVEYAVDMMPLLKDPSLTYGAYVKTYLDRFQDDIYSALESY